VYLYNDKYYEIIVIKKHNKNLYIRVKDDFKIYVTAPYFYTNKMINNIVNDNTKSINKMIDTMLKKNKNSLKEEYSLLGKSFNVVYKDINKPIFNDNVLIIKNDAMLNKWYLKQAKDAFKLYLDEAYYVFEEKIPYPKLKIRKMKTRWGVCNIRDNSVTLNFELIKKDKEYLNYVIIHELSHFIHFDHSKSFWQCVSKYCPNYKEIRKKMKEC